MDEKVSAKIESIIPPRTKDECALYNIKITYQDVNRYKKCPLKEISEFRRYIIKYIPSVNNLPFPSPSIFSYLPFIGYKYTELNWDILIEYKFILDDFFNAICNDPELYKLSEFNKFFDII